MVVGADLFEDGFVGVWVLAKGHGAVVGEVFVYEERSFRVYE